jgi:LysM repeat protein
LLLVGLIFILAGCFRSGGPEIAPTVNSITPTPISITPTAASSATPFVTPFESGQGPDTTLIPTLDTPKPTLEVIDPDAEPTEGSAAEDAASDLDVNSTSSGPGMLPAESTPLVQGTAPFVAGPTFTPQAGAPPVNLNPSAPTTEAGAAGAANTAADTADDNEDCVHIVQVGDTAYDIAVQYNLTLAELIEYNNLADADQLSEGDELQIPNCGVVASEDEGIIATSEGGSGAITPPASSGGDAATVNADGQVIHVVEAGQNLFRIAIQYGVTMDAIVQANGLPSQDAILSIGQQLIIPVPAE